MSDEKPSGELSGNEKLLNLMRFWLFGTFVMISAATTTGAWLFSIADPDPLTALRVSWPGWAVTAVLCVATYYGYKWYLGRKA